jgi:hypothetical protein
MSFVGNWNGNWGASRNCVIQSDFNSSQMSKIYFPNDQAVFVSKNWPLFLDTSKKKDIQIRWSVSHVLWRFSIEFSFAPFIQKQTFFHSKSKRWKLWGKIYWKLHFLVFPYFLFCKYFPNMLKRREILVVFSKEWMEFLIMSFGRFLTF